MPGKSKRHSPVAFGILGAGFGLIVSFVISIPVALHYEEEDWMSRDDAFEAAGNTMAPVAILVIAAFVYLGVRWARKRNQDRPPL